LLGLSGPEFLDDRAVALMLDQLAFVRRRLATGGLKQNLRLFDSGGQTVHVRRQGIRHLVEVVRMVLRRNARLVEIFRVLVGELPRALPLVPVFLEDAPQIRRRGFLSGVDPLEVVNEPREVARGGDDFRPARAQALRTGGEERMESSGREGHVGARCRTLPQ
jgi:hypothetical protein